MISCSVEVDMDVNKIARDVHFRGLNGVSKLANEVMVVATPLTPRKHGKLRQNRRKDSIMNGVSVSWLVGYAAVQEAGRRRGARPFTRYTTPGTGAKFVEKAIESVAGRGIARFFQ